MLLLRRQSKGFARSSSRARAAAKAQAPSRPSAAAGRRAARALEPDTPAAADALEEVRASAAWAPALLVAASPVLRDAKLLDCWQSLQHCKYTLIFLSRCHGEEPLACSRAILIDCLEHSWDVITPFAL